MEQDPSEKHANGVDGTELVDVSHYIDTEDGGAGAEADLDATNPEDAAKVRAVEARLRLQRVTLEWRHLHYFVKAGKGKQKGKKCLLNDVSGIVQPGEMLAIMGGSGAGKSSLMNVLSARSNGVVTGDLLLNGRDLNSADVRRQYKYLSSYVLQDDLHLEQLTVRETLMYSARLRLPRSFSYKEKMERVDSVIMELGLIKCQYTRIGGGFGNSGISGGEKKRLSIGVELLSEPSILFLDEPTTGLDSFAAHSIVQTLVKLAQRGRTIIASIHQPPSNVFGLFDKLIVLSESRTVYFGPAQDAIAYFTDAGFPIPRFTNPADHYLDICTSDTRSPELQKSSRARMQHFVTRWAANEAESHSKMLSARQLSLHAPTEMNSLLEGAWANNSFTEFFILLTRSCRNFYRQQQIYIIQLSSCLIIAFLAGALFWQLTPRFSTRYGFFGIIIFMLMNQGFQALGSTLRTFPMSRTVFLNERSSGTYRVSSYFFASTLGELPVQIFFPALFCAIVYWATGLNPIFYKFCIFLLTLLMSTLCAISVGLLISALIKNEDIAGALSPMILLLFMLTAGFYRSTNGIPGYFIWVGYISFVRWGFQAALINQFEGFTFDCDPTNAADVIRDSVLNVTRCATGDDALRVAGLAGIGLWTNIAALAGLTVGYRALTYLSLRFLNVPAITKRGGDGVFKRAFRKLVACVCGKPAGSTSQPLAPPVLRPSPSMTDAMLAAAADKETEVDLRVIAMLPTTECSPLEVGTSQGFTLAWRDINCTAKVSRKVSKPILLDSHGVVKPGQLLAIMGPSGAGKSTLLNILAGVSPLAATGSVLVGGKPRNHNEFKRIAAYVRQGDLFLQNLTVRETLLFAANIRLPKSIPHAEKIRRVDALIAEVGLGKVRDSRITRPNMGSVGLSGGERKRLSIAVELIADPAIIFLDEPTAGLDSFTAHSLILTCTALARAGRTVVMTIHQPRSNVFQLFDQLLLLAGGRTVYFGNAQNSIAHFAKLGHPCPSLSNPCDYFLDLIATDNRSVKAQESSSARIQKLCTAYASDHLTGSIVNLEKAVAHAVESEVVKVPGKANGPLMEFLLLLQRSARGSYRNIFFYLIGLLSSLATGIIVGLIFVLPKRIDAIAARDTAGALFFILLQMSFGGITGVLRTFPASRALFLKERGAGAFRVSTYFLSEILADLPLQLTIPIGFAILTYWMVGLAPTAAQFFIFLAALIMTHQCAIGLGLMISAISPSAAASAAISPLVMLIIMLCSGFLIGLNDMPIWFFWVSQVSFLRWAYSILMMNQFVGFTVACDASYCVVTTGEQVLTAAGMGKDDILSSFMILLGWTLATRIAVYLELKFFVRPKRLGP